MIDLKYVFNEFNYVFIFFCHITSFVGTTDKRDRLYTYIYYLYLYDFIFSLKKNSHIESL